MNPKIKIPNQYKPGFQVLVSLSDDQRERLISTVAGVAGDPDPTEIAERYAHEFQLDTKTLSSVIEVLLSLYDPIRQGEISPEGFISGVITALNEQLDEKSLVGKEIKSQLLTLFEDNGPQYLSAKSDFLSSSREKLYIDSRIITDIRPIFSNDEEADLQAATVIHTLKIRYVQDDDRFSYYFALDHDDLEELKKQIERALKKHQHIENIFDNNFTELKFY